MNPSGSFVNGVVVCRSVVTGARQGVSASMKK